MTKKKNPILKSQAGFSLIELMIVVAIIGILATIAVPNFQRMQAKAKQSEAKMMLGALFAAEKAFAAEWQVFTGDFRDIGFQPEGRLNYHIGFAARGTFPPAPYRANLTGGSAAGACFNSSIAGCGFTHQVQASVPAYAAAAAAAPCTAGTNPANAAGTITFNATAQGQLNGQNDVWTMNHNKVLCNNVNGV